jgi:hypothetical protein
MKNDIHKGGNNLKYKVGNIVLLYSGEMMYIYKVDEQGKRYYAVGCENQEDSRELKDTDIFECSITT